MSVVIVTMISACVTIGLNTEYKHNNVQMEAEVLKTQSGKRNSLLPAPRSKNIEGGFMTYLPSIALFHIIDIEIQSNVLVSEFHVSSLR